MAKNPPLCPSRDEGAGAEKRLHQGGERLAPLDVGRGSGRHPDRAAGGSMWSA
jgi:hypothetical protein